MVFLCPVLKGLSRPQKGRRSGKCKHHLDHFSLKRNRYCMVLCILLLNHLESISFVLVCSICINHNAKNEFEPLGFLEMD